MRGSGRCDPATVGRLKDTQGIVLLLQRVVALCDFLHRRRRFPTVRSRARLSGLSIGVSCPSFRAVNGYVS